MGVYSQASQLRNCTERDSCKDVREIVSNLSTSQKKKIDVVIKQLQSTLDVLKQQESQVKDSINRSLQQDGDQSTTLYPLFEREATIKCTISKETYNAKVNIEKILTARQKEELRAALDKQKREKRCR